jgi:tetratricopeptide (TPR) repeat protein
MTRGRLALAAALGAVLWSAVPVGRARAADPEVTSLERRSKAFYALVERGKQAEAAAAAPGLERDLAAVEKSLDDRLDRLRDEVTDRDGDVEALYKSAAWRDAEIGSLVVGYHLAWVRYQAAQLTDDAARKKKLLRDAAEGFSRFTIVEEPRDVYAESLYGRGLAFMDLGEYQKAIKDLTDATGESRVAAKARAALAEAKRRAAGGKPVAAPTPADELARLIDLVRAAGRDTSKEKQAMETARGLAARGKGWPERVEAAVPRSSFGLRVLAQLAVDRNRCATVATLAEESARAGDAGKARHRPEILYLDAGCRLNAGRAADAAERFAVLLREYPDTPRAADAAYYRFRALDVARAADPSLAGAYQEALETYLARFPKGGGASEARFLLAELYRSRGDCARASAEYERIPKGEFATRARLGTLECRVGTMVAAKQKATAADRAAILDALRAFVRDTPARGDDQKLVERAALLGALVAAGARPPDDAAVIELLAPYDGAQALELRLVARVGTGDLAGAAADLDAWLATGPDPDTRRRTLRRIGRTLVARVHQGPSVPDAPALALARTVYAALAEQSGTPTDLVALANLELRADAPADARRHYEAALAVDGSSSEAIRGAARAAAAAGDREAALAYWRQVLDTSPPGGTSWYEARIAQVTLLAEDGRRAQACEVLRGARGRATTAGADQLESRLSAMEPEVCR